MSKFKVGDKVRRIRQGGLREEMHMTEDDEVGTLIDAFAGVLRRRHQEIGQKVNHVNAVQAVASILAVLLANAPPELKKGTLLGLVEVIYE